ncbi:MAG: alcohol dehydrogenase catalytic domain-containing protein [Saprospiraceae bacterium]
MKAILQSGFGGTDTLYFGEAPDPTFGPDDLLVNVHATALNRGDLLQRKGQYPPPLGVTDILGLEMAGTVAAVGSSVHGVEVGDPVCGLLPGGGYAQRVAIPAAMALPLHANLSFTKAAAIPEAFLTAYQAIHWLADLRPGERILVHAGASGIGTAVLQLASMLQDVEIFTTASSPKHTLCTDLGAHHTIDYKKSPSTSTF